MKVSERLRRDTKIVQLYEDGCAPSGIARQIGLRADRVRQVLKSRGYTFVAVPREEMPTSLWALSDNARRIAIWSRARKGAQQTLSGQIEVPPTIHSIGED